jgi:Tfp pilus assembly protein PilX
MANKTQQNTARTSDRKKKHSQHSQQGAALIIALLLLLLLTGMTVAMVLSTSSDMLINGYYRNFRGSFYAADSGLTIARQDMVNNLLTAVPSSFSATTQPIPTSALSNTVSYINATYGTSYQSLNQGQAATSWPAKFKIDTTRTSLALSSCTVLGGGGTCTAPTGAVTGYQYIYNYTLTGLGQSRGTEAATVDDAGSFTVTATLTPSGATQTSFAAWGMFIDQYGICSGGTLVPGTITGPVFTNGAWTFSDAGSYIFTDSVGSVSGQAGYSFSNGPCDQKAASSDSYKNGNNKSTIAPTFQSTFNLGQSPVPLPQNDYSQQRAVLDGVGTSTSAITNSDLNSSVKNIAESPYPANGASTGVYLPYTVDPSTGVATLSGGGIYVQGNAGVQLSLSGTTGQTYTITQGGTTTTITINNALNTTTLVSGGTTLNLVGVPTQHDPATGAVTRDATMLYVNGNITSLSGPGPGVPAVQDGTALTITAAGDVTVTGDILYNKEPVTTTQNQIPGSPADTLIPGNNSGQVLGIFTGSGDIQLKNGQSNGNLEIDASLATISNNGTGGLINVGSQINTLSIVGGRIQNQIKNIGATTRNVFFDRRFAQNKFAPPWFPSTTVQTSASNSATLTTTIQRTNWFNRTTY